MRIILKREKLVGTINNRREKKTSLLKKKTLRSQRRQDIENFKEKRFVERSVINHQK